MNPLKQLGKLERRLRARIRGIVRRATVGNLNTGTGYQTVQAKTLADDVRDDVELFEPYGFTSSPPAGSEALVFSVGGDGSHLVALAAGSRTVRLVVDAGEVAVYNEAGARIVLRADGSIEAYPADGQVVRLGGDGGLPVARETDPVTIPSLTVLQTAIAGWAPVAADGGAALKTALAAWLADPVNDGFIETGGEGSEST